ncbi:lamin tail domain-containing protein, partial [Akkermansiaceae bacterium]|nr:lamin tail domain-containing protein [Akkermansiaceae bacterium]
MVYIFMMSLRPFILTYTLTAGLVLAGVVINEIHYHPVEEPEFDTEYLPKLDLSEDVHEFIELYNDGDSAVSLAGWE